jgi:hypothetical protein
MWISSWPHGLFVCFSETGSLLCSPGWPGTHLSASASWMLWLQVYSTRPRCWVCTIWAVPCILLGAHRSEDKEMSWAEC